MTTPINVRILLLAAVLGTASLLNLQAHAAEKASPLAMQDIKLQGFWKQHVNRMVVEFLPHLVRQLEADGEGKALMNILAAGQVIRGEPVTHKHPGGKFSDAFVFNTVEAICLALEVDPDGDQNLIEAQKHLKQKLEEWIPIILQGQEPSGHVDSHRTLQKIKHFSALAGHEFYVMGYFIEMGVAHYRMTKGKDRRLYDAAIKCADYLDSVFGPAPKRAWQNGHPGIEMAFFRLGESVNASEGRGKGEKYFALAKFFLDNQHKGVASEHFQADRPAVEMREARGHAVMATYFYTAMAGVARHGSDDAYGKAVDAIWSNAIDRKHFLTGGVGVSHHGESFGEDFELTNISYCESCAGSGMTFWATQMWRRNGAAHFMDVQERTLYNNLLGSVDMAGKKFYYRNPLMSQADRYSWYVCPCCAGNIPRALIAIKDLIYGINPAKDTLYVNHFVASEGTLEGAGSGSLRIKQETEYPWQGSVVLTLRSAPAGLRTIAFRLPNRTESPLYTAQPDLAGAYRLSLNGAKVKSETRDGYVRISANWKAGDRLELNLPLEVQRVHCDERVVANRGRVAIMRGPIVYNFESVDHGGRVTYDLPLSPKNSLQAVWKPELLGGLMAVEGGGLMGIPNYARLNRGGFSQVWMVEDVAVAEMTPLYIRAKVSASLEFGRGRTPTWVNDGVVPREGALGAFFSFEPRKGTNEWLQYDFVSPATLKSTKVWWFMAKNPAQGGLRIPAKWQITYQDANGRWVPVSGVAEYPVNEKVAQVNFSPVQTKVIRLEFLSQDKFSTGIHEWIVE